MDGKETFLQDVRASEGSIMLGRVSDKAPIQIGSGFETMIPLRLLRQRQMADCELT